MFQRETQLAKKPNELSDKAEMSHKATQREETRTKRHAGEKSHTQRTRVEI